MLEFAYSTVKTVMTFGFISVAQFMMFYLMVLFATRSNMVELVKSFYKAYVEALVFVLVAMVLLVFIKVKNGVADWGNTIILFEQMYSLMLFLSLVLTCSMHYPQFSGQKYKYAFFGLIFLLLFLLFYHF